MNLLRTAVNGEINILSFWWEIYTFMSKNALINLKFTPRIHKIRYLMILVHVHTVQLGDINKVFNIVLIFMASSEAGNAI